MIKPGRCHGCSLRHISSIDGESEATLDLVMDQTPESHPSPRLPWDFHPALTEDRLRLCARLLANARRDALACDLRDGRRQLVRRLPGLCLRPAPAAARRRVWHAR